MEIRKVRFTRIAMMMLLGCVIGFTMLILVFCLPLTSLKDTQETADLFRKEGNRPAVIPTYTASVGDGYTDALMLAEALFTDEEVSVIEQAVHVYRRANSESASIDLADMLEGKEMQWEISYGRYWHGYLVILRPLLMLFSYADLRMMICAVQMILFALTLVLMTKKDRMELIIPFIAATLTLSPMGTLMSLQYFAVYFLMMMGILAVLCMDEWLRQGARYFEFFLLMGMLTCYFDFLTYPLVTLCVPLLLVLYVHREESGMLRFAVAAGVMWCVGYLGFWAMKWVVGSLVGQENLIRNALYRVLYWVSSDDIQSTSSLQVIADNVSVICRPGYLVLYVGCIVGCMLPLRHGCCGMKKLFSGARVLLLILGLAPFAWWFVVANHSQVHSFYTYRLITITVFAVLLWLTAARKELNK